MDLGRKVFSSMLISAFSKFADSRGGINKITFLGFNFVFGNTNMNLSIVFPCRAVCCPVLRLCAGTSHQNAEWSEPSLEYLARGPQLCPRSPSQLVRTCEQRSAASDTPLRGLSELAANLGEEKIDLIYLKFLC